MSEVPSLEKDLRAIEAVNHRDVQFAVANDADKMMSQWTDDIVLLQSGAPIMRGRAAIAEAFRAVEGPEVLDYVLTIEEIQVCGDYAFEWGTYYYRMRLRPGGETSEVRGKIMRVLQRQPDGSWKIHRGMTTMD